jgi:hypothetical protein
MSQSMSGVQQAKEFIMNVLVKNLRNLRLAVEAYHLKAEQKCSMVELHESYEMIQYWMSRVEQNQLVLEQLHEED